MLYCEILVLYTITYTEILQQLRIFDITTEKESNKQGRYEEGLNPTLNDKFPTEPQVNQMLN